MAIVTADDETVAGRILAAIYPLRVRRAHTHVGILLLLGLALATTGGAAIAQSPAQLEQLQQIIEQQQRQLEEAQRIIEQQQRAQESQQQQIEALEDRMQALQPIREGELVIPPMISGGPLPAVKAEDLVEEPSALEPVPEAIAPGRYSVAIGANLNRQASVVADGNKTKAYFVDSSNVPTFGFIKGKAKVNEDLTLGAHLEAALQDNSAASVSQTDERAGFNISGRFFEATADSQTYGKGSFGKGFASSFFLFETDKSGTQFGNLASVGNAFPGLLFYSKDLDGFSDISVGDAFVDVEGLSLINRVRYDTPYWHGLQLSGTYGENQYWDGTLRYANDIGDFNINAATSFINNFGDTSWRQSSAAGVLHKPTGLNLSSGYAVQKFDQRGNDGDRESPGFLVRPGWRGKLFAFGDTKTAVDLSRVWDVTQSGDVATSVGAFVVQDLDAYGLQVYAGYRYFDLDRDDLALDQIHLWSMGVAATFDTEVSFGGL
ncbi:MAG: hypothetical protein AAF637_17155 [Pseudomonadota bacterium]